MASTIENEILTATGQKAHKIEKKETRQKYLMRLLSAVGEAEDPTWGALSEATQSWYDTNVKAHANDKNVDLIDFPNDIEEKPVEAVDEVKIETDDADETPEVAEVVEPGDNKRGGIRRFRLEYLKNPTCSVDNLIERVNKAGFSITKISAVTTRSCTRTTVGLLKELGIIPDSAVKE
jgi:hypothetical protein